MSAEARAALAPGGRLRVGLYAGSPTSFDAAGGTGEPRGVGHDLGRELARRLGASFEPVVFASGAEALAAAKAGRVDLVFTNATPARARDLDFSPVVLELELGFLVPGASPLADAGAVDREGVRVGVSEGSTSHGELPRRLRHARVVPVATLASAAAALSSGALEAFATNKAILFAMADGLPGARVLAGSWGAEHLALGIPKGRAEGLAELVRFAESVAADGFLDGAVARAGLRGARRPGC